MPLFGRKSGDDKQQSDDQRGAQEQALRDQQASIDALSAGGLPLQAVRRLEETRKHPGMFTSDLSVDEFLLVKEAGFQPITQVMGSSVYHVGFQRMMGGGRWAGFGSQELTMVSGAMNHARALALGRLDQEARLAGADAVVGVRVTRGEYDWAANQIEFQTIGTAVRLAGREPASDPTLTNLSGQDFWKLLQAGYAPMGIVAATSVFYVAASWTTQNATNWLGGVYNQELKDFTAGLYQARASAMGQVRRQAAETRAGGIVGMVIERHEREVELDTGSGSRTDMIFTFHVMGTAITPVPGDHAPPSPEIVVPMS